MANYTVCKCHFVSTPKKLGVQNFNTVMIVMVHLAESKYLTAQY